jgi:bacteriorhodopsin
MPAPHILQLAALKAAGGFHDIKPIEGVSHFIDALQSNLAWLLITALILVILVLGGLFFVGNSNAHRYAMNVMLGVAIVACAGGIVA